MKKIIASLVSSLLFLSCAHFHHTWDSLFDRSRKDRQTATFIDPRDGQSYETIKIGNQWWMAENLNYDAGQGCFYYDDNDRYGKKYGMLYTLKSAIKACPDGWRLPSDNDWQELEVNLGMPNRHAIDSDYRGSDQGEQLKKGGSSGFDALLGGWRNINGSYLERKSTGIYWSSTKLSKHYVWIRGFSWETPKVSRRTVGYSLGLSVRCLKEQ
jgi:uncharacterized protein (TIGR02145 family)